MEIYLDLFMLLNAAVDFLLLAGVCRLTGGGERWTRLALSSGLGGLYAGLCLVPGLGFLQSILWRLVSLAGMVWLAFGLTVPGLRKGLTFVLLTFALGGLAGGAPGQGAIRLLLCAAGLMLLCCLGLGGSAGKKLVPVELVRGDVRLRLTALVDTGNLLRDPISGRPVLITGADTAGRLAGLRPEQLAKPLDTMANAGKQGLRLIPYRSLGCAEGLLLAVRCDRVRVNGRDRDMLVAFSPELKTGMGTYQALTGGV